MGWSPTTTCSHGGGEQAWGGGPAGRSARAKRMPWKVVAAWGCVSCGQAHRSAHPQPRGAAPSPKQPSHSPRARPTCPPLKASARYSRVHLRSAGHLVTCVAAQGGWQARTQALPQAVQGRVGSHRVFCTHHPVSGGLPLPQLHHPWLPTDIPACLPAEPAPLTTSVRMTGRLGTSYSFLNSARLSPLRRSTVSTCSQAGSIAHVAHLPGGRAGGWRGWQRRRSGGWVGRAVGVMGWPAGWAPRPAPRAIHKPATEPPPQRPAHSQPRGVQEVGLHARRAPQLARARRVARHRAPQVCVLPGARIVPAPLQLLRGWRRGGP